MKFRLKANASLDAENLGDAFDKIIRHFQGMRDQILGGEYVEPSTFDYDSQIRVYPIRIRVIEEELHADTDEPVDDRLAG